MMYLLVIYSPGTYNISGCAKRLSWISSTQFRYQFWTYRVSFCPEGSTVLTTIQHVTSPLPFEVRWTMQTRVIAFPVLKRCSRTKSLVEPSTRYLQLMWRSEQKVVRIRKLIITKFTDSLYTVVTIVCRKRFTATLCLLLPKNRLFRYVIGTVHLLKPRRQQSF